MSLQRQRFVGWFVPAPYTVTASTAVPPGPRPTFIPSPYPLYHPPSPPSYSSTLMADVKRPSSPPSIPVLASLIATPRRFRTRTSIIALVALLAVSCFCILHQHLNDVPISKPTSFYPSTGTSSHTRRPSKPLRPIQVHLSNEQELAALVGFMAALPSNALLDTVDPSQPLNPDLILGFDIRSSIAASELNALVEDTWTRVPIVLLSKKYSPVGREIKSILAEYNLVPPPVIFDMDERGKYLLFFLDIKNNVAHVDSADEQVITSVFQRLLGTAQLPVLLLHGESLGTIENIRDLHSSGQLRKMISTTSAIIDGATKKKGIVKKG